VRGRGAVSVRRKEAGGGDCKGNKQEVVMVIARGMMLIATAGLSVKSLLPGSPAHKSGKIKVSRASL
jgi:hypothetical protein